MTRRSSSTPSEQRRRSLQSINDRFHDPVVRATAILALGLDATMAAPRKGPAGYRAEVSRRYRQRFGARQGVTYGEARKEARHGEGGPAATAHRLQARLRTGAGLEAANERLVEHRAVAFEGLRRVRSGEAGSPAAAERQLGLTRGSLRRELPSAFDAQGNVRAADREAMVVRIICADGDMDRIVRGSRQRALAGQHRIVVYGVLEGRLPVEALDRFKGVSVGGVPLETDPDRLLAAYEMGRLRGGPYPEVGRP